MAFRMHNFICFSALAVVLSACAGSGITPERFRTPETTPPPELSSNSSGDTFADPATAGAPNGDSLTANPGQNVAAPANAATAAPDSGAAPGGATSDVTFGRTDLLGGWKVAAGSDNCELFMSLTGWAGGYRAVTKGCASAVLTNVQAWNLNEKEVVLISGNGETVARLYATAKTRFNGQTEDGIGVTVYR